MGNYLTKGTTFADGGPCNAALLNAHVDEAILKPTTISSQTLKDPAALSDEILINDGGTFKKITPQQLHNLILYPGSVVQTIYAEYTANANLGIIPFDDTIPQSTEGTEIISLAITPRFATSTILARFSGQASTSVGATPVAALFRDAGVNALATTCAFITSTNERTELVFSYMDSPATVSAITYRIRAGANTGTTRFNGNTAARFFGGSSRATLTLQEIKV